MSIVKIKDNFMKAYSKTWSDLYFKLGKDEAQNLLITWTIDLNKIIPNYTNIVFFLLLLKKNNIPQRSSNHTACAFQLEYTSIIFTLLKINHF
jgi:hypothetical protein